MELSQALGIINVTSPEHAHSLSDRIPAEFIQKALTLTAVTLRKRKLPLESMIWLVVGMSIFCNRPMTEIVNLMDIADRTGEPFTARSSVIPAGRNGIGGYPQVRMVCLMRSCVSWDVAMSLLN